jgi:hypothetical protein
LDIAHVFNTFVIADRYGVTSSGYNNTSAQPPNILVDNIYWTK